MAINRFAILTDGFDSPGVYVGSDFGAAVGRALLVTNGYFPRALSSAVASVRWIDSVVELVKQPFKDMWKCITSGITMTRRAWSEDYSIVNGSNTDLLTRKPFSEDYSNTGQSVFDLERKAFSDDYIDSVDGVELRRNPFSDDLIKV